MALTICTRNETNKDGSVLLHVRFKTKQFDKKIPTKIKVIKKHWDNRNKRLKPNHPYYDLVNKKLKKLSRTVNELYDQNTFAVLTYEEARNRLLGGSRLNDIVSYMDQHLKNQIKENTFNSYRGQMCTIATHFNGTRKITFEELADKNRDGVQISLLAPVKVDEHVIQHVFRRVCFVPCVTRHICVELQVSLLIVPLWV